MRVLEVEHPRVLAGHRPELVLHHDPTCRSADLDQGSVQVRGRRPADAERTGSPRVQGDHPRRLVGIADRRGAGAGRVDEHHRTGRVALLEQPREDVGVGPGHLQRAVHEGLARAALPHEKLVRRAVAAPDPQQRRPHVIAERPAPDHPDVGRADIEHRSARISHLGGEDTELGPVVRALATPAIAGTLASVPSTSIITGTSTEPRIRAKTTGSVLVPTLTTTDPSWPRTSSHRRVADPSGWLSIRADTCASSRPGWPTRTTCTFPPVPGQARPGAGR